MVTGAPSRIVVTDVAPSVAGRRHPVKRVEGEPVDVRATVICDGHDELWVVLSHQPPGAKAWVDVPMGYDNPGLDRWGARFTPIEKGTHRFKVLAWVDHYASLAHGTMRKVAAGLDVTSELLQAAAMLDEAAAGATRDDAALLKAASARLRAGDTIDLTDTGSPDRPSAAELRRRRLRRTDAAIELRGRGARRAGAGGVQRLVRAVPALDRHWRRRRPSRRSAPTAPCATSSTGSTTSATSASTSSTSRRSTPSAGPSARARTTPPTPAPTTPAARGRSAGPRAATPRSTPSSARSTTSRPRRRGEGERHRGRPRPRLPVLARPPLGHRAPRVVPPPARRHHPVRREPAEEVPGHLPARLRDRRRGASCGRRCSTSSSSGSTRASPSSGSTTPTPSRSRSGSGSSRGCTGATPTSIFLAEAFTRPEVMYHLARSASPSRTRTSPGGSRSPS